MINSEDSESSENETNEGHQNSAVVLLNSFSTMINNASVRLSESLSSEVRQNRFPSGKITYDKTISAKHEYLGTDLEEVRGRTLHDEGSIVWLPILMELEVVLVPGQTLPLTAFYPPTVSMFKKIITKDKTFGVVCINNFAQYGTTAEIFQFQEDSDLAGFRIKAKGRQRFKLLEQKGHTPGILIGKVLILPEISLVDPLYAPRFVSLDRYRKNSNRKSKISFLDAVPTPWPFWVYQQYDTTYLVKRVTEELKNIKLDIFTLMLPTDAVDLSYWVAQCLPIDGINRIKMLSFDTAVERLQYALSLLSKCQKLYCVNCGNSIADRRDVFSMSTDGPQGMYCNSEGYVHDVVTVYNGTGMSLMNQRPSEEYSWFPGYGWTIAQCSNCDCHIGWLFTAMKKNLKPVKFWGLSRKYVTIHQKGIKCEAIYSLYVSPDGCSTSVRVSVESKVEEYFLRQFEVLCD